MNRILSIFVFLIVIGQVSLAQSQSVAPQGIANPIMDAWLKEARKGDSKSQQVVGATYAKGKLVPQNFEQAEYWSTKAAEQGNFAAQYDLGQLYDGTYGFPLDYKKAYAWYALAYDANGYSTTMSRRDGVASKLPAAELEDAKKMASDLKKNIKMGSVASVTAPNEPKKSENEYDMKDVHTLQKLSDDNKSLQSFSGRKFSGVASFVNAKQDSGSGYAASSQMDSKELPGTFFMIWCVNTVGSPVFNKSVNFVGVIDGSVYEQDEATQNLYLKDCQIGI